MGFWLRLDTSNKFEMDSKYLIPTALRQERRKTFQEYLEEAKRRRQNVGYFQGPSGVKVPVGLASDATRSADSMAIIPRELKGELTETKHKFPWRRLLLSLALPALVYGLYWAVNYA